MASVGHGISSWRLYILFCFDTHAITDLKDPNGRNEDCNFISWQSKCWETIKLLSQLKVSDIRVNLHVSSHKFLHTYVISVRKEELNPAGLMLWSSWMRISPGVSWKIMLSAHNRLDSYKCKFCWQSGTGTWFAVHLGIWLHLVAAQIEKCTKGWYLDFFPLLPI